MLLDVVLVMLDGIEAALSSAAEMLSSNRCFFVIAIFRLNYAVAGVLGAFQTQLFGLKVTASSLLVKRHGHTMCCLATPGPALERRPRGERSPAAAYGDASQPLAEARIKEIASQRS